MFRRLLRTLGHSQGRRRSAANGVGQATFEDSLAALRRRGFMVLYGASSGPVPPFDPQRLNTGGSLFLTRPPSGFQRPGLERPGSERAAPSEQAPEAGVLGLVG